MAKYTYEQLKDFVDSCTGCSLCEERNHTVMGRGKCRKGIMLVAEGPGKSEDMSGIPFTGRSGKVIDHILEQVNMDRDDVYITNIVKCHPPQNRNPLPEEQEQCLAYLRHEFVMTEPKVVVCLGRVAAQKLIRADFKITREHGEFTEKGGTLFTATYHPSAVLRNQERLDDVIRDFRKISEEVR